MNKLSIERLSDFERDPSNNFLTRSEMMEAVKELIALRELKLEINWPVAQKVRAALDRAACPDAFMRIAVEACTEALKGDQVPVAAGTTEKCSPDVYAKGVSACLVDIPKEKAEVICRGISAASGVAVDWHYFGGRVHIKTMRFPAPQKPVISKEKLCEWLEDNFDIDDSQRDAFANCFAHHCNCIVKQDIE